MMTFSHIKAIVISEDHYNALGMVRSLGIAGIKINLILTTTGKTYVDSSKFVTKTSKVKHTSKAIIKEIKNIVNDDKFIYVLFPLSDFAAQIIDDEFDKFPSYVIVPNACGKLRQLSDKYLIKKFAEESGLDVPKGIITNFQNENNWNTYPAIIKPLISIEGVKSDILIVSSYTELIKAFDYYKSKGYVRALIEEYIDGEDSHMVEVMGGRNYDGTIDFAGIISKIREFPIYNGSTSYAKIVSKHDGIDLSKISFFLEKTKFIGLFDFEFKCLGDKAYFIECNYRNGAPGFVFTKQGINMPVQWIQKNVENIAYERDYNNEILFMVEQNDLINMLKGTPSFIEWISQYRKSVKIFAYKGDYVPVIKYYYKFLINLIYHIFRRKR